MALQKNKIAIPLTEGINTKIDPNQKPIGTLEVLENAAFTKPGKIQKRKGYDKIDVTLTDDTVISDTQKITKFKDELCLFNSTNFYSYSESTNRWSNKGTVSNIFSTSKNILRNTYEQSNIDSNHVAGLDVYAWEDTRSGIRISIIDNATGNELLSDTQITSTGTNPRVEKIGNVVYIFYIDSTSIKYRKINPIKPSTIEPEVSIINNDINGTNSVYSTLSLGNRIFIAWNSLGNTLKIFSLLEDDTTTTEQEEASESPTISIDLFSGASSRIYIAFYDGSDVKLTARSFNNSTVFIPITSIETVANIINVTGATANDTLIRVFYEQTAAAEADHVIKTNTITSSAGVGTAVDLVRSCGLSSKAFVKDSRIYFGGIHKSDLQASYFFFNSQGEVVSKISQGIAGNLINSGILPKVSPIENEDKFLFASQIKGRVVSEDNVIFSLLGVNSTELDFDTIAKYDNAALGENLHTAGGMIQSYDGQQIVEHGFHIFPEGLTAGTNASSGGSMSDGTYLYSAIYSWIDNKGQKHRSAPSIALSVTTSAGGTSQTQQISVPTLRVTEKNNVTIELYRTESLGSVFYLASSITSPVYNDKTINNVTITDTLSDSNLIDNEILYTTGGVLENIAPPSASIIETFNNRIFLAGLEDPNLIQYSKIRQNNQPVEFNDTLLLNLSPRGGNITSLAEMDDKLIIFKENAIFYLSGEGPNNLGEQNDFIEPELVSDDLGCINQNSVVLTPQGLMFKSNKGIYLLGRNLSTNYIGANVEDFNNFTVTSANLNTTDNIVIFLTDNNALVYNYFLGKWSVYTNHRGISAVNLRNNYYYVRQNNEIYKNADHYTDAGSFIKLRLTTSWLSFAGLQGFQRVYRMLLLGEYKSPHKLIVTTCYDFQKSTVDSVTIDSSSFIDSSVYGSNSPYGSQATYGGSGDRYQVRVNFRKQKCETIKITVEDSQSSSPGEGLEISNLLFVIGAKRSEFKTSQNKNFGTSQ